MTIYVSYDERNFVFNSIFKTVIRILFANRIQLFFNVCIGQSENNKKKKHLKY